MKNGPFNFRKGEVILCDKPLGWTSFKVVHVIRRTISRDTKEKLKVGHAGTLDPLATGLLVICTGRATKTIMRIQETEKEYTGTIRIGSTTPSYDLETEVNQTFEVSRITDGMIVEAAAKQTGPLMQNPPLFSAKQVDGTRAYKLARKGDDRILPPRPVVIDVFEITGIEREDDHIDVEFRIVCSKGTYIRSVANDLGKALNNGAHLTVLRRTRIGEFSVDDAIDPDQLKVLIKKRGFLIEEL